MRQATRDSIGIEPFTDETEAGLGIMLPGLQSGICRASFQPLVELPPPMLRNVLCERRILGVSGPRGMKWAEQGSHLAQ